MVRGATTPAGSPPTVDEPLRGVRWLSLGPGCGIGDASEVYLSGLRDAGVPVSWSPLGWPSILWNAPFGPRAEVDEPDLSGAVHADIVNRDIEHDTVVVCSTPLWHERLAAEAAGRRLVAYTMCETDRLPAMSVQALNHYDGVIVPSTFNAEVLRASGVRAQVEVVPHGAPLIRPPVRADAGGRFVFYLISTWTTRKAIPDAISAFLTAFSAEDDVSLVIHTTPEDHVARARMARGVEPPTRHATTTWSTLAKALAGRRSVPEIVLSTRRLSATEVHALHQRGDCFFSLSRGEGWGLGAFDAGAHGNPSIVTGWGGSLDYLPDGYPYCVEYDLVPTVTDEPDAWWEPQPGERWAKADPDHAAALLRHVYEHRAEARAWGARLQEHMYATFTRAEVSGRLIDVLSGVNPR